MGWGNRDPAIKLFGETISLPPPGGGGEDISCKEDEKSPNSRDDPKPSSTVCDDTKPDEEQHNESSSNLEERPAKKPGKNIPCPRCKSTDTKFCYYNNYKINQPRHLCKNCQRYWTAGGTMRTLPVGAGRRKNKSYYASHFRQLRTVSDPSLQTDDILQRNHHPPPPPEPNEGTILSFGPEMPLYESMASALNLADETSAKKHCDRNRSIRMEEKMDSNTCNAKNGDEEGNKEPTGDNIFHQTPIGVCHGSPPQPVCFNGSSWYHPWCPPPAFCNSSFATPMYPAAAYWGCAVPAAWSIPWSPPFVRPNSPTLGKHSRDGTVLKHSNTDRTETQTQTNKERCCLWIPKTLRIDDPKEAAKSSIWEVIGAKNEKAKSIGSHGLFKAFDQKADTVRHSTPREGSRVLYANPAALSRSLNFHESS